MLQKKCDQYWPNEGSAKYGDVTVELLDNLVYFDFTIRTFKLTCASTTRIVKQFHFTTWSDHGALTNPTPLLNFRRKVQLFNPDSSAPLIIHCSAGIGRTGTYIAIDYLLQQARAEGVVDVLKCANLMRANRINMIQTWSCALYWPEEYGYTVEYGPLSIELLSSQDADPVSVRIFRLSNRLKGEERAVKQFQLKSWSDFQKVPSNSSDLLQLYDSVQDWIKQNGRGPVTVHCMNGASKSGLFCAISLLFERMQRDHEVDVFQTVKTLRINRPQFIEDIVSIKMRLKTLRINRPQFIEDIKYFLAGPYVIFRCHLSDDGDDDDDDDTRTTYFVFDILLNL
ncbi:hypothetical protein KUTeg_017145 [Tegillarca granosa]|uniref:protein-tyrosine-phosphatase n=1 Tax=Tegillarca granosa TaxID=220873 RepID=A0ABQ9ET80_TEGGR|nr:hypothetical protein KUTeg_017145 [Tegillarca granosa]